MNCKNQEDLLDQDLMDYVNQHCVKNSPAYAKFEAAMNRLVDLGFDACYEIHTLLCFIAEYDLSQLLQDLITSNTTTRFDLITNSKTLDSGYYFVLEIDEHMTVEVSTIADYVRSYARFGKQRFEGFQIDLPPEVSARLNEMLKSWRPVGHVQRNDAAYA